MALQGNASKLAGLPPVMGEALTLAGHAGVIDYAPSELVVSVRAGTPVAELDALLAGSSQMLASEPPTFGGRATVGGALATGWSGPRRPWAGSLRDHLLGLTLVDGRGELLRFGGRVMKNVAGFDVARACVGGLGRFGAIVEAHLRVLPRPEAEQVLVFELSQAEAILRANQWSAAPLPLSGAAWADGLLRLRLSGNAVAVAAAVEQLGGEPDRDGLAWFDALRGRRRPLFDPPPAGMALYRLSLPQATPPLLVGYRQWIDWAGGLRWLHAPLDAAGVVQGAARLAGGHATRLHPHGLAAPVPATVAAIQHRLRAAFDPAGILNRPAAEP
ncbi:glycolate oxidase subunit GlcE [Chitinimonas koreensis]|uniref:glycolate oxidase subunit GlcE n=1 Tax=Chitinimonas koreensis TaxID=356302 RepID=UPI00223F7AE5|nr:glycolate oxidase subunit GlcE [Chitinimonas koreensis]